MFLSDNICSMHTSSVNKSSFKDLVCGPSLGLQNLMWPSGLKSLPTSDLECLGLRVNFAKSSLFPSQCVSFLRTIIDSTRMRAVISPEQALPGDSHLAFGTWTSTESELHINYLEMLAICQALQAFLPLLVGHHVLVHLDSMTVVSFINHQGGLSSKPLYTLVKSILEWAQCHLLSLRAMHVWGVLNRGADMLSRSNLPLEEWMLYPQTVQKIWDIFGRVEVDLFASDDNYHCPTYFSKNRDALAHDWHSLLLYAFLPVALIPQVIK